MSHLYRTHGLLVSSEVPIDAAPAPGGAADVDIAWGARRVIPDRPPEGELVAHVEFPGGTSALARAGCRYTLRINGIADFDITSESDATLVRVSLSPTAEAAYASLLMTNVLALILTLRGHCVLHASAVAIDGRAVAFIAASGGGKSTSAALCCTAGATVVSDDALRVELAEAAAWCFRGSAELRLRQPAAGLAAVIASGGERSTVDSRVAARPAVVPDPRLPLAAIVVPLPEPAGKDLRVERLTGPQALLELVRNPRTTGWISPAPVRNAFGVLAGLTEVVPVFRARVPWGPPFAPDLGARLLSTAIGESPALGS